MTKTMPYDVNEYLIDEHARALYLVDCWEEGGEPLLRKAIAEVTGSRTVGTDRQSKLPTAFAEIAPGIAGGRRRL